VYNSLWWCTGNSRWRVEEGEVAEWGELADTSPPPPLLLP